MIRSITKISKLSILDVSNDISFNKITLIDFDDNPIGSGGFGKIYNLLSINKEQTDQYVIKIFSDRENEAHGFDTIEKLHNKLKKNQLLTSINPYVEYPELLGLPFVALKGFDEIEEVEITAFIMLNLNKFGFIDYGAENNDNREYRNLPIQDKIFIGHQLAIVIDFMHSIKFIHSDLKEAAIWYNPKKKQLAIIDFDSGYHFDSQKKPSTIGAIGHWISGGLRNIIGSNDGKNDRTIKERLSEEYWILSNALFELFFDVMPYFFLKDSDDITKKNYLNKHKWPQIENNSPFFLKENQAQYNLLITTIETLKNGGLNELFDNFYMVFNKGYNNNSKRITPREWASFLDDLNFRLGNSPKIVDFRGNKTKISEKNEEVVMSYKVVNSRYITIDGLHYSPIIQSETTIICSEKENHILLKAYNTSGETELELFVGAVTRTPKINMFKSSKYIRDTKELVELRWNTEDIKKISITNVEKELVTNGSTFVDPRSKTTYILKAVGFFDETLEKELVIDIILPRIKRFDWEINLNEGIRNVDVFWETEETQEVRIEPKIGIQEPSGLMHIPLRGETILKLTATGIFESISQEIVAYPFPAPIIKQLFVETPKMEISTRIESIDLKSFKGLEIPIQNLNSGISFFDTLELPKFETNNSLVDSFNDIEKPSKDFAIHTIFKRIKNIINQS